MDRLFLVSVLSCLGLALATGVEAADTSCPIEFKNSEYCAKIDWLNTLTTHGPNTFTLTFWNPSHATGQGPYSDPADLPFVKLWMPEMGHGSSPVTLERAQDGVYNGSKAYFVMPGTWDVHVQLKRGQAVVEEAVLTVRVEK